MSGKHKTKKVTQKSVKKGAAATEAKIVNILFEQSSPGAT